MKTCTICNIEKPIDEFLKDKSANGGYRNQCKQCLRERNADVWEKRKEVYNKAMRKYRDTTKGAVMTSYVASKTRATKDGIPFNITRLEILDLFNAQNGKCALTGVEMIPKSGWTSPSLDKMDPKLGYVSGNIQWVTKKANLMKSNLTMDELLEFCHSVIKLRC